MAHKSPYSKEISDEWERLLNDYQQFSASGPPPEEFVAGWQALHARAYVDGRWLVSAPDAGLVAHMGSGIAYRLGNYAEMAARSEEYLSHPKARTEKHYWETMTQHLGLALILTGRTREGLGKFDELWEAEGLQKSVRVRSVLWGLGMALEVQPGDSAPDPLLQAYAASRLGELPGKKRIAKRAAEVRTNRELNNLLVPRASHVSPYTKEIYDEWNRLLDDYRQLGAMGPPPEGFVTGWQALHARAYVDGHWLVFAGDAGLVADMGSGIAYRLGDYSEMIVRSEEFLSHPDAFSEKDRWERMTQQLGLALILNGQVAEGLSKFDELWEAEGLQKSVRFRSVMWGIGMALEARPDADAPDPLLQAYAARRMAEMSGKKRVAKRLTEPITIRELGDFLHAHNTSK